jgi:hypothetical protein
MSTSAIPLWLAQRQNFFGKYGVIPGYLSRRLAIKVSSFWADASKPDLHQWE